jgi:DNA-binding beta-propeller fold protein YncE
MYVTQSTGDRNVLVFSTEGAKLGTLTAPGGKAGNHLPVYVAVNPKTSEVYVSDRATGAIYVYDVSGKYLREFKPKGLRSWAPLALAFDKDGNLFVTDVSGPAQKVLEVAADGTIVKTMGLKDGLSFPNGVAVLDDGKVAVSDSNNSRVLVYAPDGKTLGGLARGTSDSSLGLPRGLAVDDRGRLYVVDTVNHDVQAFVAADTPGGVPTYGFTFGEEGSIEGTFSYPNGVAVDTHGRIFVTDRANDRVQVWSY